MLFKIKMEFKKVENISIEDGIKEIEKLMINDIFEYLNNGIARNNKSSSNYLNCLNIVYYFVDSGDEPSKRLLNYHNKTIEDYLNKCAKKLNSENINLIDEFLLYTEKINYLIWWMNKIFHYLDRQYNKSRGNFFLSKRAMNIYKSIFLEKLESKIFNEIDKLINEERNGNKNIESINKIKKILEIFNYLNLKNPKIIKEKNEIKWVNENNYNHISEPLIQDKWINDYFFQDTKEFVEAKAKNDLKNMSITEYILSTLAYLEKEYIILDNYIDPKYHNKINEINYQHLIINALKDIIPLDNFVKDLLLSEKSEQKNNLYKLIKLIPKSIDPIISEFDIYIKNKYDEIFKGDEIIKDYKKYIIELIKFKKEMDNFVKEHFKNNNYFKDINNKTFSSFMRKEKFVKELCKYIDYCMKIGFKGKSEEEIENTLNEIISLFKCLDSKLEFQIESEKNLSERLLKNESLSIITEQKLISKLKEEAGVTYVIKMSGMVNDLEKNKINTELYKSLDHKGSPNDIKLNVTVVSQHAWEIRKNSMFKIILPKYLSICLEDFEKFYVNKYKDQKLIWCLGLSKIEIKYLYLQNKNISISNLPQLLSLLLLEEKGELSLDVISQLLGCQPHIIINDIQGLIYNPSFNQNQSVDRGIIIGTFNGETKEFKESDIISINKNFTCSKMRFTTLPLKKKKPSEEIKKEEIEEQKIIKRYESNIIQATLTRIMKSRIGQKTTHLWLVEETVKQIDLFNVQPQQIKENIEKLIEKNIIKRDEEDRNCYIYIA